MAFYPGLDASSIERRRLALEQFAAWRDSRRFPSDPATNLRGIAWLWRLLSQNARERPVDPRGVQQMRERLAVLGRHDD